MGNILLIALSYNPDKSIISLLKSSKYTTANFPIFRIHVRAFNRYNR